MRGFLVCELAVVTFLDRAYRESSCVYDEPKFDPMLQWGRKYPMLPRQPTGVLHAGKQQTYTNEHNKQTQTFVSVCCVRLCLFVVITSVIALTRFDVARASKALSAGMKTCQGGSG